MSADRPPARRHVSSTAPRAGRSKPQLSPQDAFSYAVRVALLVHLLAPRQRRPAPPPPRPNSNLQDMLGDFSLSRDPKALKPSKLLLPSKHFFPELEARLKGVITKQERQPGYNDPLVNRTFGAFLNAFLEKSYRGSVEKSRRVEDLVLIFYSSAVKALQQNVPPNARSDWVKEMTDRHVALFVRLVIFVMKDGNHVGDRPELLKRLQTLEAKLLAHESVAEYAAQGAEFMPVSYDVKDMPMVQLVGRVYGRVGDLQNEINANKDRWTDKVALDDLKDYNTNLNLNSKRTLRSGDFDLEDGYDAWRRTEVEEVSKLIGAIVQANPDLAKYSSARPPIHNVTSSFDSGYSDAKYEHDLPDVSTLRLVTSEGSEPEGLPYTFIPRDPRAHYRFLLNELLREQTQDDLLLSPQALSLLETMAVWWRVPAFSRVVIYQDVLAERFRDGAVSIDELDVAFSKIKEPAVYAKTPVKDPPRREILSQPSLWTISDFSLNRQMLMTLHDALGRELYHSFLEAYSAQPPAVAGVLVFLETHVLPDPIFGENTLDAVLGHVKEGLKAKAEEIYREMLNKNIPEELSDWEFGHVIQLGTDVKKLCQKMQKRYKKNSDILGVKPFAILIEVVLPLYAHDAHNLIGRIMVFNEQKGSEPAIDDAFELYKEMAEIRSIYVQALPSLFPFSIEDLLESFVWRWIDIAGDKIEDMVDAAIKEDSFGVRAEDDRVPLQDERHSSSIIDLFALFKSTVKKIQELNWDNDLHYAKFMTALAKTIGQGVTHYCQCVEKLFYEENNRLSPEQEAAASATAQERWLKLAKDAWNNKEKVEPFNFYPQSFVKLNNIEFALLELDRLEKVINVDACAAVIKAKTPLMRPASNFVFTVKIVEAENLQACDINGLSDPFVVLVDEYRNRLAKTRVIYANLNPRWDESFDITTQKPLNLIATVWDWDRLGQYDVCGRTLLKLDPSQFSDYMPRDISQQLDTQGTLLFRVSMEGEKDDIEFYFGKAFRTLKRTERDMTRQITDKLTAYIGYCLSRNTLKGLLSRKLSIATVSNLFRNQAAPPVMPPTQQEIEEALTPLLDYFHDNFSIMQQTLTATAMILVMTRLWKETVIILESLLVPPLSDKPSQQKPLTQQELDIVFKWLNLLFDFFNAVDPETNEVLGVPVDILRSQRYHDLIGLNFFYFDSTDNLIRTSERIAAASEQRLKEQAQQRIKDQRMSAPALGPVGLIGVPSFRRAKSIMMSRNLGTLRKAKAEKRTQQAEADDESILRLLRMRPEAANYLRWRSNQKRTAAIMAERDQIIQRTLQGTGERMQSSGIARPNGIIGANRRA